MTIDIQRHMTIFARVGHEMLRGFDHGKNQPYRCCHVVWSGFNHAFRVRFPGQDPVAEMQKLERLGYIELHLAQKGKTFEPTEKLLKPLTAEEQRLAAEIRVFFAPYVERQKAKGSRKPAKPEKKTAKPKPNGHAEAAPPPLTASFGTKLPIEERADELWLSGKHAEAAALLGFTLSRS